ncbi:Vesicle transport protein [Fasciolopsis buskii]|uniref:Vesicle transport protein n=1 Tax=Fasciolopsis buskii TaxID=27845 RepID=A0A8E0RLL4_9TREM|nr:Vesicle transport protein [Fasciolopsis buski]
MLNHILPSSDGEPQVALDDELPAPLRSFLGLTSEKPGDPTRQTTLTAPDVEAQGRLSSWFNQSDTDPLMPKGLSRKQRLLGFAVCLLAASFCLCLAMVFLPLLTTPFGMRKYVLLHSLGSVLLIASFSFLWGPWNHLKSLFTWEKLPFTVGFTLSLFGGLYAVLVWHSAVFAALALATQLGLICWQIVVSIPGGRAGLQAMVRGGYWTIKGVARGLPV